MRVQDTEIRTIASADGVRLVADVAGPPDAPVVVMLHGGGQTRHSWSGAMRGLVGAGYRVVNFDARGHGDSDWSGQGAYTLDDRAADLRAVVADVAAPFALVGASLGGSTAIHAIAQGMRPAALVLVDIVPNADRAGIARVRRFMESNPEGFATIEEAADAVAAYNPERRRPADPDGLRRNLRASADGRLRWHWDPAILDSDPAIIRATIAESSAMLPTIAGLDTLLVRGMRSDVVSDASVEAFRKLLPSLEILEVAGAGHMVAGDRNDAFNTGVLAYLGRVLPVVENPERIGEHV